MSQMNLVNKFLSRNTKRGITASMLSEKTGLPVSAVYRRVHDLVAQGTKIEKSTKNVNGRRQVVYRLAA